MEEATKRRKREEVPSTQLTIPVCFLRRRSRISAPPTSEKKDKKGKEKEKEEE